MKNVSFHNTIRLTSDEFNNSDDKAKKQEEVIMSIFKRFQGIGLTPFMVEDFCIQRGNRWPIVSIRRAMTNLTKNGFLYKSAKADAIGVYGTSNHRWYLSLKCQD